MFSRKRVPVEVAACAWCAVMVYDDQPRISRSNSNPPWIIHRECAIDNVRYLRQFLKDEECRPPRKQEGAA